MHGHAHIGASHTVKHAESVHGLQNLDCLMCNTTIYNPNNRLVACELPWYRMDSKTLSHLILWNDVLIIAEVE